VSGFGYTEPVGRSIEWYTPPEVFDWLGLEFDLDPASPPGGLPWIPAARHYTQEDDGLSQPWEGRVWLNPPYGPHIGQWMMKMVQHMNGIALVPARTETNWWHDTVVGASSLILLRKRLTFVTEEGVRGESNAGHGTALIAYGDDCDIALMGSRAQGMRVSLRGPLPNGLQGSLL
jgi:hypothetical protein